MGAFLMLEITPSLQIDERELQIDFIRSSGPGGQNVNKVATAVQLRFDVGNSRSSTGCQSAPDPFGRKANDE